MLTQIENSVEILPPTVAASAALAAEEITPAEYNTALRVVKLKDSARKLFHETIWSRVEVGDVVLKPWPTGRGIGIAKAQITSRVEETRDGKDVVVVFYLVEGLRYGQAFEAGEAVYIQSRL